MTNDLEQLGPTGFQDLAAALAIAVFGAGIQVMGGGRDGGRDMYYKGALTWTNSNGLPGDVWEGYTVFQVKHKRTLANRPADNASWLWGQIRKELEEWADPGFGRGPVPDHMIIVSNVPLTPTPRTGGHDVLQQNIARFISRLSDSSLDIGEEAAAFREIKRTRLAKIKNWRFWDGYQIQALLSTQAAVRRAFRSFFTAADVFANLKDITDKLPLEELEPGLRAHARSTLTGEGLIYFDEAGSGDSGGFPVHEIAVDLPIVVPGGAHESSVIRYVLDRAENVLKPRITTFLGPRHLVLTGAPGNGKTTMSKYLVQIYRAAMLNGAVKLSADQQTVIDGTVDALGRFGRELPKNRRWAMRIDLADYAQEGGLREDSTLLRWIAHKVSARSDAGSVSPSALQSWMKQWPWFLVLDGLDEVSEPVIRRRLIQQVTEFVNEAEAEDCDLLVILTTRPMGYSENIAPTQFEQIDLDYLGLDEAVRYGTLATRVRLRADTERIERVVRRLEEAAKNEALQNLLRTPLQVLILTIIVDGAGQLSPDRYSLFWGYYDTVVKRERAKTGGLSNLLREHSQQIQQLHERVGFELQVLSEAGDAPNVSLSYDELRRITWTVLHEGGFQVSGKDADLLGSILEAATKRLVLIAPRVEEGYGFDVRSLQELMAAMYLTAGPLEKVLYRLRQAAASPHWRNAWIFAAGKLFSIPQPHQHQAVVELVESIDDSVASRLGGIVPIGPRLALEIIDDGMARSLPKWRSRLIRCGLKVLLEPRPDDLRYLARIIVRFANTGGEQSREVAAGIRDALEGNHVARDTVTTFQALIPEIAEEIGAGLRVKALGRALQRPNARLPELTPADWEEFDTELLTAPLEKIHLVACRAAGDGLRHIADGGAPSEEITSQVLHALQDPAGAKALEAALTHVIDGDTVLRGFLRNVVLSIRFREPLGELLSS